MADDRVERWQALDQERQRLSAEHAATFDPKKRKTLQEAHANVVAQQQQIMWGGGSRIHTVLFEKIYWSRERVKQWLRKHGFGDPLKITVEGENWRARLVDPSEFTRFSTGQPLKNNPSIRFVFGYA